jgi:hypothetical protein
MSTYMVGRGRRSVLGDITADVAKVLKSPRPPPQLHDQDLLTTSSTSSSEANSPRLAASSSGSSVNRRGGVELGASGVAIERAPASHAGIGPIGRCLSPAPMIGGTASRLRFPDLGRGRDSRAEAPVVTSSWVDPLQGRGGERRKVGRCIVDPPQLPIESGSLPL